MLAIAVEVVPSVDEVVATAGRRRCGAGRQARLTALVAERERQQAVALGIVGALLGGGEPRARGDRGDVVAKDILALDHACASDLDVLQAITVRDAVSADAAEVGVRI